MLSNLKDIRRYRHIDMSNLKDMKDIDMLSKDMR